MSVEKKERNVRIYQLYKGGLSLSEISRAFQLRPQTVDGIIDRQKQRENQKMKPQTSPVDN